MGDYCNFGSNYSCISRTLSRLNKGLCFRKKMHEIYSNKERLFVSFLTTKKYNNHEEIYF